MGADKHNDRREENKAHLPVMLDDILGVLEPLEGLRIVDGTFGAGGYSRAFLQNGALVTAIDRDPNVAGYAADLAAQYSSTFSFVMGKFSELDVLANSVSPEPVDIVVLDIGVSSMQLDQGERGFSFMREGPLDMRMSGSDPGSNEPSAADIVGTYDERALADLIFVFGEERKSRRIAKAIVAAREECRIETTTQLAEIIEKAIGRKPGSNHPATRTFQALRIAVNGELDELVEGLFAAERLLPEGGRLLVVTFHSLEDRIVKRFFDAAKHAGQQSRHMPPVAVEKTRWAPVAKPIKASDIEITANPRARSAMVRWAARTGEKARSVSFKGLGVPNSGTRSAA